MIPAASTAVQSGLSQAIRMLAIAALLIAVIVPARGGGSSNVDLALVLAVDCSDSVNRREFRLQIDGLAHAFRSADVISAVQSGPNGRIAVALFEWSDFYQKALVVEWTIVDGSASAEAVAQRIEQAGRVAFGGTSISTAIAGGIEVLSMVPWLSDRSVIDVSGDGANTVGERIEIVRDRALALGIVINGLAINNDNPDLTAYYQKNVIGGPGSFVIEASGYETFAEAIRLKLMREIFRPVG
jgi:Protein of unknown function (DUF1194)